MAKKGSNVVYSTLTANQEYTQWKNNPSNDIRVKGNSVLINGGSNLANKVLVTPRGVATIVSDEELAFLRENKVFQRHVERGYITVQEGTDRPEVEKGASDLVGRDESSPLVPEDFENVPGVQPHESSEAPKTKIPTPPAKK